MLLQELSVTISAKYTAGSRKTFPGTGNKLKYYFIVKKSILPVPGKGFPGTGSILCQTST